MREDGNAESRFLTHDDDDREKGTFDVSSHLEQKSHLSPFPGTGVDPELTLL